MKYLSEITYTILVFLLIFGFPVFGLLSSSKVAILFSILLLLAKPKRFKDILYDLQDRKLVAYLLICIFFSIYTLFLTMLYGEFDFSLFQKQASSVLYFILIFVFFRILSSNNDIPKLIINAFILQSLFILLAILSQEFYDITNPLRKTISLQHIESYSRFRGNAIAGYQFFGVSTMYGFVMLYYIINKDLSKVRNAVILVFISIFGVISGRYAFTSILLGSLIVLFSKVSINKVLRVMVYTFIVLLITSFLIVYLYHNILSDKIVAVVNYQIIYPVESLLKTGHFKSSSTAGLFAEYTNIKFDKNLFFGDARYMSESGLFYYKQVDSGVLRMIYYYGIFGLLGLFIIQYILIFGCSRNVTRNQKIKVAFYIYFILLNIKGDVFFYSNNSLPIVVGFLYFSSLKIDKIDQEVSSEKKEELNSRII